MKVIDANAQYSLLLGYITERRWSQHSYRGNAGSRGSGPPPLAAPSPGPGATL